MSTFTVLHIVCDVCGAQADDCGGNSAGLRRRLAEGGWHTRRLDDGKTARVTVDLCPACLADSGWLRLNLK